MDYQFPPSSPVLDAVETDFDPFRKDSARGRTEYPTPNPSSTVGRSSSPARHENDCEDEKLLHDFATTNSKLHAFPDRNAARNSPKKNVTFGRKVSINRDFNILNPDALVVRVPLLDYKSHVVVGRSSKSCDYHFKSIDRYVSRKHVRIDYSDDKVVFTCLGFNGFGMIVPRVCQVTRTESGTYQLRETGKPLAANNMPKSIHLDYQHTEFHVARDEKVEMPRFTNVLLQVREYVLLINPDDYEEELTDDEVSELIPNKTEAIAPDANAAIEKVEANPLPAKKPVAEENSGAKKASISTTTPVTRAPHPKTPHKTEFRINTEEETPCKAKGKENEKRAPPPPKRAMTPLANRSTNLPNVAPAKRRAASEEPAPVKKVKYEVQERDENGELIIDESITATITNLGEIENILINHLAFSRLSSTPASFLNTILAVISNLTLQQLRAILHKLDCIGVIYRQGKDAAGKPLEEEYYYVPENDNDPERSKLVALMKGHGGLRSCRRTHKQYYWKKPAPIKK